MFHHLTMKMIRYNVCTLFIIICFTSNTIDGVRFRARRKIDTDKLTKEDLDQFLDTLLSRREDNVKKNVCVSNFEEEDGVILRTHDSIHNGAEFMNAPKNIDTSYKCKQECCNGVSKKSGRRCDLAVYLKKADDPDKEQSQCFLFSCTSLKGDYVCLTSPNDEYKILKRKDEHVVNQLFDIAANDSTSDNNKNGNEVEDKHGECVEQFTQKSEMIIRTSDSISNGAEFLGAPDNIDTMEKCQSQCCVTVSEKTSRHCDFAVYQQIDDNVEDKQRKCFLFSCTDDEGKFTCITSSNSDYVTLKRNIDVEEDQLLDIASSSTIKPTTTEPITESTTTTSTKLITKTSTPTSTTLATTTIAPTTFSKPLQTPKNVPICTRLEWKCDDGSCIRVTEVCNGKFECADNSDEIGCGAIIDNEYVSTKLITTSEPLSTTTTVKSTTQSTLPNSLVTTTTKPTTTSSKSETSTIGHHMSKAIDFEEIQAGRTEPHKGAVLPLALGLSVTACVLFMVTCRFHIMKKKLKRRGKPLSMEESDYLINGMYL